MSQEASPDSSVITPSGTCPSKPEVARITMARANPINVQGPAGQTYYTYRMSP